MRVNFNIEREELRDLEGEMKSRMKSAEGDDMHVYYGALRALQTIEDGFSSHQSYGARFVAKAFGDSE